MRVPVFILGGGCLWLLATGARADERPKNPALEVRPSCQTAFERLYDSLVQAHRPTRRLILSQNDPEFSDLKNNCVLVCAVNLTQAALMAGGLPPLTDPASEVRHWENYWTAVLGEPDRRLSPAQTAQTIRLAISRHLPESQIHHRTLALPLPGPSDGDTERNEIRKIRYYDLISSHSAPDTLETKKLTLLGVNAEGNVALQHAVIVTGRGRMNGIPYIEINDPNFPLKPTKLAAFPLQIENCNGRPNVSTIELSYPPGENPYLNSDARVRSFFVGAVTTLQIQLWQSGRD